jgi:hypothetical protein
MKTNNYQVKITMRNLPADDRGGVELELFDVLRAINQLPYDYELSIKRDGEWL